MSEVLPLVTLMRALRWSGAALAAGRLGQGASRLVRSREPAGQAMWGPAGMGATKVGSAGDPG